LQWTQLNLHSVVRITEPTWQGCVCEWGGGRAAGWTCACACEAAKRENLLKKTKVTQNSNKSGPSLCLLI